MAMEGFAFDKIEHANEVVLFILDGISMHEIIVAGDQIEDTGLFFTISKFCEKRYRDFSKSGCS
jgi:hypothetical protein